MSYVHVLRTTGYYLGQVRPAFFRQWRTVTGRCRTAEGALAKAANEMRSYKRARVLFVPRSPYYEPHVAIEALRR